MVGVGHAVMCSHIPKEQRSQQHCYDSQKIRILKNYKQVMFGSTLQNIYFLIGMIKWCCNHIFGNIGKTGYVGGGADNAFKRYLKELKSHSMHISLPHGEQQVKTE
jgi:hypothetical protein